MPRGLLSSCACCGSTVHVPRPFSEPMHVSTYPGEGGLTKQVAGHRKTQTPWLLGSSARRAPVVYTPLCAMPERRSSRRYMRARYSRSAVCRLGSRSTHAARAAPPPPHSALSAPCRRHPLSALHHGGHLMLLGKVGGQDSQ